MKTIMNAPMIFVLFLFIPITGYCQYKLSIEISPLKNNNGQVLLALMDENENIIKEICAKIEENRCKIVIQDLQPGKYAFKYFHDENKNKKLDTKLFIIPKEGYGFSNNAKGKFGPPPFKDMIFDLEKDVNMICKPH